jgi:hypothetical protein
MKRLQRAILAMGVVVAMVLGLGQFNAAQAGPHSGHGTHHGTNHHHHHGHWYFRNGRWVRYETIYVVYYRPAAPAPWVNAGNFYSAVSAEDEAAYLRGQGYETLIR